MAQACDGFTKTALMGNWYEQREFPKQPMAEDFHKKTLREREEAISFPSVTGQLCPLACIKRNLPWETKGCVVDDGYKEFRSQYQTHYDNINYHNQKNQGMNQKNYTKTISDRLTLPECNRNHCNTQNIQNPTILNENNMGHLKNERVIAKNVTDFGSSIKQHNKETHEKFYGMTTNQFFYGRPIAENLQDTIQLGEGRLNLKGGNNERNPAQQSTKMTSILTAEKYKNQNDPKENSNVQKSWLPAKDKGLQAAENNLRKNQEINEAKGIATNDPMFMPQGTSSNEMSLPMGDEYKKLPKLDNYRHMKSEITMVQNKPFGKK